MATKIALPWLSAGMLGNFASYAVISEAAWLIIWMLGWSAMEDLGPNSDAAASRDQTVIPYNITIIIIWLTESDVEICEDH